MTKKKIVVKKTKNSPITSAFEERAIEKLRESGFRITMPRIQVLRALLDAGRALTPYEIHERILQAGGRIDVVSVYRILTTLTELDVVHFLGAVNGFVACGMQEDHEAMREHAICNDCGSIQEISVPDVVNQAISLQLVALKFQPKNIRVEILGRCAQCMSTL